MQVALILILPVIMGMAIIALSPPMAKAFSDWLKGTLGPLGYAISFGVNLTLKLVRYITFNVGGAILDSSAVVVGWINTAVKTFDYWLTWALAWPVHLYRVTAWLLDHEIPRLIAALPHVGMGLINSLGKRLNGLRAALGPIVQYLLKMSAKIARTTVEAALAPWLPVLRWAEHRTHALDHVLPKTLGLPAPRDWQSIKKRLAKLDRLSAAGLAVGAVAIALRRLGLEWLRCKNVKEAGKRICGLNLNLLESLLADTLLIASSISIVELAHEVLAVEDEIIAGVKLGFRELRNV